MSRKLAPCIAIVGPANSGKTTLVHLLDRVLQRHPARPLVYVVPGHPDGTGRYLFFSRDLREPIKPFVKGRFTPRTFETVTGWIKSCRRHLDLVLVDLGGRHSGENLKVLRCCTHYLVLSRRLEDPEEERMNGLASWVRVCEHAGLKPIGRLLSLPGSGPVAVKTSRGLVEGTFRPQAVGPTETGSHTLVHRLVRSVLKLGIQSRRSPPGYLDLRGRRPWDTADLRRLAVRVRGLARLERGVEPVVLGGVAPTWAYAAAMHRVLISRPRAPVWVFDPKKHGGLVPVPTQLGGAGDVPSKRNMRVAWTCHADGRCAILHLIIRTPDKLLPPDAFDDPRCLPLPRGRPPEGPIVVSGKAPIWLHVAYSRWLRCAYPDRTIGLWDATSQAAIFVTGPGTPRVEPMSLPVPPAPGASRFAAGRRGTPR